MRNRKLPAITALLSFPPFEKREQQLHENAEVFLGQVFE